MVSVFLIGYIYVKYDIFNFKLQYSILEMTFFIVYW